MRHKSPVSLLLLCCAFLVAVNADARNPPEGRLVFDRGAAPPPLPSTAVRVLNEPIDRPAGADAAVAAAFQRKIVGLLAREYVKQHGFSATRREIARLNAVIGNVTGRPQRAEEKKAADLLAESAIVQWKMRASLFRAYGGRVTFERGPSPFLPVDAWRKFVEWAEGAGVVEFYDPQLRAAVYERFTPKDGDVIPPDKVTFDKPWWEQKPRR